ncbi:hypothetical protein KC338_g257 [Hortaea werneckii]|nr:hypothetical protein KC338_g257 [Hortaea werneckii]
MTNATKAAAPRGSFRLSFHASHNPDAHPIPHQSEEIGEDVGEVLTASNSTDCVDDDSYGVPDDSGHFLQIAAKDLKVDTRRISRRDEVRNQSKCQYHRKEGAKRSKRCKTLYCQCPLRNTVGIRPRTIRGHA